MGKPHIVQISKNGKAITEVGGESLKYDQENGSDL
jgi:hypothetical protein